MQRAQRIETLSWVEQATVERRLPDTIVVNVQERRPFAIWQNHGKFVLIDRAGQVVADQDVANFRNLPLVVGPGAPAAAAPLLDALTARPALQKRVVAAVRVGERRWNLQMNNGTDVMLPEGHEVAALDRLMQLQQDHALLDRPLVAIDMRLPDRLVLRPQPEPTPLPRNLRRSRHDGSESNDRQCRRSRLPLPLREGDRGRGADPEGLQLCAPLPPSRRIPQEEGESSRASGASP